MKKKYYIREGSPMAKIINVLPYIGIAAMLFAMGVMNTWELGLL